MKERVIYEVLRIIDGKPLFLKEHLVRMRNSFAIIEEKFPFDENYIINQINGLIIREEKKEGNIKITYNINQKELDMYFIKHRYPTKEMYKEGVKTILFFGERDNPNAKIVNDNFRNKVNAEIEKNNVYEAILIDRNGFITEGSKSNIFMIKGDTIITSPIKAVLPGVTRDVIINLIKKNRMKLEEREYNYNDIDKLDAMFISGTSPKILPINSVEKIKMDTQNHKMLELMKLYDDCIQKDIKSWKK